MTPYHPAQKAYRHHRIDHHLRAEKRLPHAGDEHMRNDAHGGQNGDVNLRVPKKPEQMLPEEWGTTRVVLQSVADHESRRNEETRSRHAIQ